MKSKYFDNLSGYSLFTGTSCGVVRIGLIALVGTIIGVSVPSSTSSEKNTTKCGRISVNKRVWGLILIQDFSRPFKKLQEERSE